MRANLLRRKLLPEYKPFLHLGRINPLLRHELGLVQKPIQATLALSSFNKGFLILSIYFHGFALCMFLWAFFSGSPLPVLIVLLASLAISIGADIYSNIRTILRWHDDGQLETRDTLRLAMWDDKEFLSTYEIIGNMRSWSAFRADMSLRVGPAAIFAIIGASFAVAALMTFVIGISPLHFAALLVLGLFIMRFSILYMRDPMWRFRANTMWSVVCAIQFRDTTTAIGTAIAGGVGVRLVHLGVIVGLAIVSRNVLAGQDLFSPRSDFAPSVIWFSVLTVALVPITRWGYTLLYRRLMRRALFALRSGDV